MRIIMRGVCVILLLSLFTGAITAQEEDDTTSTVTGSRLVGDLLASLAQNTEVTLNFEIAGTDNGFSTFCQGNSDITGASRPISAEEEAICNINGVTYAEYLVGYDALALVANPDLNLECLGLENLSALFAPVSNYNFWDETGLPEIGMEAISLFVPANNTSAYAMLDAQVSGLGLRGESIADDAARLAAISSTPGALGIVSFNSLSENSGVKVVDVRSPELSSCYTPSIETIEAREYPLVDRLFVYVSTASAEQTNALLTYITSEESASVVSEAGFTPVSTETNAQNQAVLSGEEEPGRQFSGDVVAFEIPANVSGVVTIAGSPVINSYITDLGTSFTTSYPGVTNTTTILGQTAGIRELCNGTADMVIATRGLTDEELSGCTNNNVTPVTLELGSQAVVLVKGVNTEFAQCLTTEQVTSIWGTTLTNAPTQWSDISAEFPETSLILVAPSEGNPLADLMLTPATGAVIPIRSDVAETNDSPLYRAAAVSNVEGGLTFMSYEEYKSTLETLPENNQVELVEIGDNCVLPSEETIASNEYPYTTNISLIVSQYAMTRSEVQGLLWFIFQDANYSYLSSYGIQGIPFGELGDAREALQDLFNQALASGIEPPTQTSDIAPDAPIDIFASPETTPEPEVEATPEATPEMTPEATPEATAEATEEADGE